MGMTMAPQHTEWLTREFFEKHYIEERKSFPAIKKMLADDGKTVSVSCLYAYAKKYNIGRSMSASRRNRDDESLDYTREYMTEDYIESIDGLLLGDGSLDPKKTGYLILARATWGVAIQEFAHYLAEQITGYNPDVKDYKHKKMKLRLLWQGRTRFHPDLGNQHIRWYSSGKKQPPDDVRITPKSVMLWYLGDGSLVCKESTVMVRLSTDGFAPERVEFLAKRLNDIGIKCHRNGDNRIQIDARGVPAFFDFIGRKSPVECYQYKFDLPEWRFESKRMREVADELGVDYQRLAHLVKIGKIPVLRISEKGKPRFLPEHIEAAKLLVGSGELY
jgi:hypothetical protein